MADPKISKIENVYFAHQIENMGTAGLGADEDWDYIERYKRGEMAFE